MRAWIFAVGTAILGVALLEYLGFEDMTLTQSWALKSRDFRGNLDNILAGIFIGLIIVAAWWVTTSAMGQAITGASTLALGSFVTFAAIVFGSALTMKIQYYQMVYEDEATFFKALAAGLADMKMLPNSLRQLEKV